MFPAGENVPAGHSAQAAPAGKVPCVPAAQAEQPVAPGGANEPAGQSAQPVAASALLWRPAAQAVQAAAGGDAPNLPAGHMRQAVAGAGAKRPGAHAVHVGCPCALMEPAAQAAHPPVGTGPLKRPAGQSAQANEALLLAPPGLNLPLGHTPQLSAGGKAACLPAGQALQSCTEDAPLAEKDPAGQPKQPLVAGDAPYRPPGQAVHAVEPTAA
jgi:hypothetical protein